MPQRRPPLMIYHHTAAKASNFTSEETIEGNNKKNALILRIQQEERGDKNIPDITSTTKLSRQAINPSILIIHQSSSKAQGKKQ